MDPNTKEMLSIVVPSFFALIGTIVSSVVAIGLARVKEKQAQVEGKIDLVAKGVDGLTKDLVHAEGARATLIATAAEKVAQEDREHQQAKGAAAARQADAGAKVTTPLAMASPSPDVIPPGSITP